MSEPRKILVTSALPYANGSIHLGHMLEYIQTDIWVRFQKLRGHECIYLCADDTHGAPIMLKAEAEGTSAEELIAKVAESHRRDYQRFVELASVGAKELGFAADMAVTMEAPGR